MKRKIKTHNFHNALNRLVMVEWDDSQTSYGWRVPEADDFPVRIKSVGVLVSKTKRAITISSSVSEGLKFLDKLTIPTEVVRKFRQFRLDEKQRGK